MKKITLLALISLLAFVPVHASAATGTFIKIDDIPGESTDSGHEGEIDVLGWSWGVVHSTSITRGGKSSGSGRTGTGHITISKAVDKSSANILKACAKGSHIDEAVLTLRASDGSGVEYVKITLKDLVISSVETKSPSAGEDQLTENVTLNFGEVKMEYDPQDPDGSSRGKIETEWKVGKGEK